MGGRSGWRLLVGLACFGAVLLPIRPGSASSSWRDIALGETASPSESLAAPSLVIANGIHHAVFNRPGSAGLMYAQCAARCDHPSAWERAMVSPTDRGFHMELAVTPSGSPRAAWYDPNAEAVRYAACDTACSRSSSWTVTSLVLVDDDVSGTGGGGITFNYDISVSLALDSQGLPAVAYTRQDDPARLLYARCTSECSSAGSWSHVVLETTAEGGYIPASPELAFSHDNPVLLFHFLVQGGKPLITTCSRACLDATSWTTTEIDAPYITDGDLQFDGERAGLVYTMGKKRASSQQVNDKWLVFVSCDRQCTDGSSWSPAVVFDDVGDQFTYADYVTWNSGRHYHGAQRPRLQWVEGKPRVAYASCVDCGLDTQESHVFLAGCDGGCTQRSNWSIDDLGFTGPQALAPALASEGTSLRFLYTRYQPGETHGPLYLGWCDKSCVSPPVPTPPSSSSTTTTTTSPTTTTTTTIPTSTTTTTEVPANAHAPSAPVLLSPANSASLYYGQPEKFALRSSDPDGDLYKTVVVVRKAGTGEAVATYESTLTVSGLEASAKPSTPLPPGSYEWTARSIDVNGHRSSSSAPARFTVQ